MAIDLQQRMVVEYGIEVDGVWLPLAMLRRLDEHGPWNVPFTEASAEQAKVLVAHGLAEPHNTGLAEQHARWENHVRYIIPLDQQLEYLRSAGFAGIDVYWKKLENVIYGGCRPA